MAAMDRLDDYRGDGSLLSWLRTIALRRCLDWRRRAATRLRKLAELAREMPPPLARSPEADSRTLGDYWRTGTGPGAVCTRSRPAFLAS